MGSSLAGNRAPSLSFQTENPATLEKLKVYSYHQEKDVDEIFDRHKKGLAAWQKQTVSERSAAFRRLGEVLRRESGSLSQFMALEMGKPVKDGRAEVEKCAITCEYYSENLVEFLRPSLIVPPGKEEQLVKEPLGSVLAVMPWNFPLWQVIRCLVPILGSGNGLAIKHSSLVAGTAARIADLCNEVFPSDLVVNLYLTHEKTEALIADRRIQAVTMTGSSRGGRQVARAAGEALKKTVLELGGSDAYILLDDAEVPGAADLCAKSRMINNGQSCISAKRFYVPGGHAEMFAAGLRKYMDGLKIDSPLDESTDVGPLAHARFVSTLENQVKTILQEGASLWWRKELENFRGAFYPPTILFCQGNEPSLRTEEFFGPVALVIEYRSLDEAIAMANASIYGLGGGVFSRNPARAEEVARRLECGFVAINDFVRSDPRLPFGGVKDSGYGRELGVWGLNEFVNLKTIVRGG